MSNDWPRVKLGEVLKSARRPVDVKVDEMYREIGIRSHGKGVFHKEPISGLELGNKKVFWVEPGTFVLNIVFAWEGAIALLGDEEAGMIGSHRFPMFHPDRARLDRRFLLYYFKTREGLELLSRVSPGGAGRNRTLSQTAFLQQSIPLPPLTEQLRVVGRIEDVAKKISEARALREKAVTELNMMLASAHNRIARGAPRKPLIEVAPLSRRPINVEIYQSYPQIAVRSFGRGTFHKPPLVGSEITWERPFLVKAGDILVSNIKAWEGALAVAKAEDDGRFGSHRYLTCVPTTGVGTARFVCFYLLTAEGLHEVGAASPGSVDRNRTLSAKAFMQIPIPMPEYSKQLWFDSLCAEVDKVRCLQNQTEVELDSLPPAIISRAFAGGL